MVIQHNAFLNLYLKDNGIFTRLFSGLTTIDGLCNQIDYISENEYAKFGYLDQDKMKGDLFEIFAELYLKLQGTGPTVGVYDYKPVKAIEDFGVDGKGLGIDGKALTVQVKFRSNPLTELTEKDIKQFPLQSIKKYGVDMNTKHNLVLFTSCVGMHYVTEKDVYDNMIRTINILKLKKDLNNNIPFWLAIDAAIKNTIDTRLTYSSTLPKDIEEYVLSKIKSLNPDQKAVFDKLQAITRLTITLPTGVGKGYLMFVDILNRIVNTEQKIFAIATHRIMLNTQHMDNAFKICNPILGNVGFVFVASTDYDKNKWQEHKDSYTTDLKKQGLNFNDIISTAGSVMEVGQEVEKHLSQGRKVVVITTYHSMDKLKDLPIDTLYCDEAHILASTNNDNPFKQNFLSLKAKNNYFLTATPKDWVNRILSEDLENNTFLMNNQTIFGERIGMKFREAVDKGYILLPTIHITYPYDYSEEKGKVASAANLAEIILDVFRKHEKDIKSKSCNPDIIGAKLLVKCASVSGKDNGMWAIYEQLKKISPIDIYAGASQADEGDSKGNKHYKNDIPIKDREDYLSTLQTMPFEDSSIVLHYDILSEGIDVAGFTGVLFLSGTLPSDPKVLQNTGRATRLHPIDRDNFTKGLITTDDKTKWIKPSCSVIIPYWDSESENTKNDLRNLILRLRRYDFELSGVPLGDDDARGDKIKVEDLELNAETKKLKKKSVQDLIHEIEELEYLEKINEKTPIEFWYHINDINLNKDAEELDKMFDEFSAIKD